MRFSENWEGRWLGWGFQLPTGQGRGEGARHRTANPEVAGAVLYSKPGAFASRMIKICSTEYLTCAGINRNRDCFFFK